MPKLKSDFVVPRFLLDQIKTRATHHLSVLPRALRPSGLPPSGGSPHQAKTRAPQNPRQAQGDQHTKSSSQGCSGRLSTYGHIWFATQDSAMKKRGEKVFSTVHECVTYYRREEGNLPEKTRQLDAETRSPCRGNQEPLRLEKKRPKPVVLGPSLP